MEEAIYFKDDFSNIPEWEKGRTYYQSDLVSYKGLKYELTRGIEVSNESPDESDLYKQIKTIEGDVRL